MTSESQREADPGWYPAPHANGELRYWDGRQWGTTHPGAPSAVAPPPRKNPLGVVGLSFAVLGTILSCWPMPAVMPLGWLMMIVALVLNIVAVALPRRRKRLALAALIVTVIGTIAGFTVFGFVVATNPSATSSFTEDGPTIEDGSASATSEPRSDEPSKTPDKPKDSPTNMPAGFEDTGEGVAIRFVDQPSCDEFTRCSQVEVFALRDCRSTLYIEANLLDVNGRVVGMTNGVLGVLRAGDRGVVDLVSFDDSAAQIELTKIHCY